MKLNLQQEQFCRLFASSEEFFGNGVQSYIEVYEPNQKTPNWYGIAAASASRLLKNAKVSARINELLVETGLSDEWVDKQLSAVITQWADMPSKVAAIKEYNKMRGRIIDKSEVKLTLPKPLLDNVRSNDGNSQGPQLEEAH